MRRATPLVWNLAAQHGVDLEEVTATGVGGRIRAADVRAHVAAASARRQRAADAAAGAARARQTPAQVVVPVPRRRPWRI